VKYAFSGNMAGFYQKVKDGINNNWPVISPSRVHYNNDGHFWVIVGYSDAWDVANSTLYVRNVAQQYPTNSDYDMTFSVQNFFNGTVQGQLMIIK